MRNTIYALALVPVVLFTLTACKVTGGPCDQVGSKHTNDDGTSYTCQKTDKGNLWAPDRP